MLYALHGTTRLITRNRLDYAPRSFVFKLIWEWFTDPIGFVMTRKMLLEIKRRSEKLPVVEPVAVTWQPNI